MTQVTDNPSAAGAFMAAPVLPSLNWSRAMPPGPDVRVKITEAYAALVARDVFFYQDLDSAGARLNGAHRYTVTFAPDQTPPVHGFWSLTMYNDEHFFVPNAVGRYSVGTKNTDLQFARDGSLTIHVQADAPTDPHQRANWLPAPNGDFSLYLRAYWPRTPVIDGSWTPPAVERQR